MSAECVIGVDIGTQGTKAVVFSADGKCLASSFRPSRLHRPRPGVVEENPEDQLASVCATIRECVKHSRVARENVAAIAIDGQMAGVIGVGTDGRAVTPYDSWLDTRCAPFIALMQKKAGDAIIRKTGGPASFNHGPKILWWKKERPAVFRKIRSFVQPGGYAVLRLCGLDASAAFIDTTYLHFSGFADNQRAAWDASLCRAFGIEKTVLPRIVRPHEIMGGVSRAMAARCGLKPGTPVAAGCGDTAASFLSCGATRAGICVDVAGTASVFAATTDRFLPDQKHRMLTCGQSVVPGLWHPYAYVNGGGMNLEWFRKEIRRESSLAELDEAAAAVSLSDDLPFFVPHLAGRVSPAQPHLRGAWAGLTWAHNSAHLYRAILEGVALEYGIYCDALKSLDPRFKIAEVRVTGGGECSRTWNSIKAAVLNSPVVQMASGEGAPMGAALLAGHAAGIFKDLDAAAQKWARRGIVTRPGRPDRALIQRRLMRYRKLLDHLDTWNLL
ncbi:MAG: FGGY family carbohydrate kinase [Terrimicrobiaceae bacterium]|nr:FGGY family carbohydrate kinase [Terrimicrobiaceae bacterium]